MIFWASALAAKKERLKAAEAKLLELAREFGDRPAYEYKLTTLDTVIPYDVVIYRDDPEKKMTRRENKNNNNDEEDYIIHSVKVESARKKRSSTTMMTETPLVLLHGYMNGAAYFYRNLVGLSHAFETIYSLDMLGWGLSSRPDFESIVPTISSDAEPSIQQRTVTATEHFFVESLEAWRINQKIPKMILCGHSMGA